MLRTSSPGPTRDTIYLTSSAPQMPLSWQHRDWTAPWLDLRWGARPAPSLEQRAVGRDILKIVERHLSISQLNYVPDRASDAYFDHLSSHISWFQIDEFRSPVDMAWLPGAGPRTRMLITARPSRIEISLLNQTMKFVEIDIPRAPARVGTSLDAAGVAAEVRASMSLLDLDYASVPADQRSRDMNAIVDKLLGPRLSRELESSQFHAAFTLTRPGEPLSTTGSVEECDATCSETRPRRFGLTPETQAWLVRHCDSLHFNLICMAGAAPANPFTQVRIADTMPFSALINRSSFLLPAPGASMFSDPIIFSYDDPGAAPSDPHRWCRPRWTIDLSQLPGGQSPTLAKDSGAIL
jgi:hypothetical protein